MVTDVGQHQMWAAQFFTWIASAHAYHVRRARDDGLLAPGGHGSGLRARTDLPVISISGDGGFQMNIQELATIVEHKLPIKIFIINNGFLGMVRQWQELFWRRRYSQVEISQARTSSSWRRPMGCPAYRVDTPSKWKTTIRKAMAYTDGPVLVEFVVAQEDNVYPMIPAGQTVNEMHRHARCRTGGSEPGHRP